MKKVLSLLLCATLCLSFSACKKKKADHTTVVGRESVAVSTQKNSPGGQSVSSDESRTTSPTYTHPEYDPDDPTPRPETGDRVVYNRDGLTVYLRSVKLSGYVSRRLEFVFFVTNTRNNALGVEVEIKTVNRYAVAAEGSVELLPHTSGVIGVTCYLNNLPDMEPEEVSAKICERKPDDYFGESYSETVTFNVNPNGA